jgi:hypothetical protein
MRNAAMKKTSLACAVGALALLLIAHFSACAVKTTPLPEPKTSIRAGLRSSPYGPQNGFPAPEYWLNAARSMASRFERSVPALVWIVGTMEPDEGDEEDFTGRVKLSPISYSPTPTPTRPTWSNSIATGSRYGCRSSRPMPTWKP